MINWPVCWIINSSQHVWEGWQGEMPLWLETTNYHWLLTSLGLILFAMTPCLEAPHVIRRAGSDHPHSVYSDHCAEFQQEFSCMALSTAARLWKVHCRVKGRAQGQMSPQLTATTGVRALRAAEPTRKELWCRCWKLLALMQLQYHTSRAGVFAYLGY